MINIANMYNVYLSDISNLNCAWHAIRGIWQIQASLLAVRACQGGVRRTNGDRCRPTPHADLHPGGLGADIYRWVHLLPWASCQIRKIVGCACAGNAGNVSLPPQVSNPDMHHGTCVTHVPWCMPESLTSGFLWSREIIQRNNWELVMANRLVYRCLTQFVWYLLTVK